MHGHVEGCSMRIAFIIIILVQLLSVQPAIFAAEIRIDCSKIEGRIRALHGVNNGPLNFGDTVSVAEYWKEISIPHTRLHDSEWPRPDVVDMAAVFPNPTADPALPASYQFHLTDDYIKPIVDSGSAIVYRLGESIEHTQRKYRVMPPADYDKWATASLGIIRHYNEGWADGFKYNIKYWEIWNEPENRPAMWTGSDADYYRLYSTVAKAIKAKYPDLKVGGPSVGATGEIENGKYQPTKFLDGFLAHCRETKADLDFYSWHTYTNDPFLYRRKAIGIRKWLNENGFAKAEMHLNEWNYLPDNDWGPMGREAPAAAKEKWYQRMGGPEGAAFVACMLSDLQDSPVDVGNMFTGDTNPFGLFSRYGAPKKTFHAFKAFRMMLETADRITIQGNPQGTTLLAGTNKHRDCVTVLLSNFNAKESEFDLNLDQLPWQGAGSWELLKIDEKHDLQRIDGGEFKAKHLSLKIKLPAPSVALLRLKEQGYLSK